MLLLERGKAQVAPVPIAVKVQGSCSDGHCGWQPFSSRKDIIGSKELEFEQCACDDNLHNLCDWGTVDCALRLTACAMIAA